MTFPTLPLGRRRDVSLVTIEERLTAVETACLQVPGRSLAAPQPVTTSAVIQASHGFATGQVIAFNGTTWQSADPNGVYESLAIVRYVFNANSFDAVLRGLYFAPGLRDVSSVALHDNTLYYLSSTAGKLISELAVTPSQPIAYRSVLRSLTNGWVLVDGPDTDAHDHAFGDARDFSTTGVSLGMVPGYDPNAFGTGIPGWKAQTFASLIGTAPALTVFGNATSTLGARTDIGPASANGVLVCNAAGTVIGWGQVASGGIATGAVIAAKLGADVTLEVLKDVTVTSAVANDFLTWNGTAWVNRNLGKLLCIPLGTGGTTVAQLGLDGGAASGVSTLVGVGAAGSRIMIGGSTSLDWLQSGDASLGTDISFRVMNNGSTVSFRDQASGPVGGSDGTEVMKWTGNATRANRSFVFGIDVGFADSSAIGSAFLLKIHGQAAAQWRMLSSNGDTFLDFNHDGGTGVPTVKALCDIDLGGKRIYGDLSVGATSYIAKTSAGVLSIYGGGSAVVTVGATTLGFFAVTPVGQQTLAASITKVSPSSGAASYSQTDTTNMCTDIAALVIAVNAMRTALRSLGLGA